jgi:hypothetical protein
VFEKYTSKIQEIDNFIQKIRNLSQPTAPLPAPPTVHYNPAPARGQIDINDMNSTDLHTALTQVPVLPQAASLDVFDICGTPT